ncbi:MAG: putative Fis family two component sigma-54 specific transcriptional regulator [Phycisphaerales bacterium]|nr:putative Fis family two component sigma-54 specific transcriptional regulator [Phycisphaerales bacterium]
MSKVVKSRSQTNAPAVLVVDDEPAMIELFRDIIAPSLQCTLHVASDMAQARKMMAKHKVELLVADICLPDGSGMDLLEELRLIHPAAGAVFMTGQPSVDQTVFALRHGVLDYLPKPFNATQASEQLAAALVRQRTEARNDRRLTRLKNAIREMNKARRTVSKKVDLLCNDLVSAYGEVSQQLSAVRIQESFRRTIEQAVDLEQLLCHAMDWLLKEAGYSNIAIWLSGDEENFELGAYMKYTIVGDPKVTNAIQHAVVSATAREGFLNLSAEDLAKRLKPADRAILPNQAALCTSCTYLGESLAVIALFRDGKTPYRIEDDAMLRQISTVFATRLTTLVKRGDEETEDADEAAGPADNAAPWSDEEPKKSKKKKPDAADWWKNGEAPPF